MPHGNNSRGIQLTTDDDRVTQLQHQKIAPKEYARGAGRIDKNIFAVSDNGNGILSLLQKTLVAPLPL